MAQTLAQCNAELEKEKKSRSVWMWIAITFICLGILMLVLAIFLAWLAFKNSCTLTQSKEYQAGERIKALSNTAKAGYNLYSALPIYTQAPGVVPPKIETAEDQIKMLNATATSAKAAADLSRQAEMAATREATRGIPPPPPPPRIA